MRETDLALLMLEAWEQCTAKPVSETPLAPAAAYVIQQRYAALRQAGIAGYKAAVTNTRGQQALGLEEPLLGVLFEDTRLDSLRPVNVKGATAPVIETEVGFLLNTDINAPVSLETVVDALQRWQPMIEIGDVGFASRPGVGDLIAGNAAGAWFLSGKDLHPAASANQAVVSLSRDGVPVHEVPATDAMGDQFASAVWMINKALALGYELKAGMVLMTGALGAPVPAAAGRWLADYGHYGRIEFIVEENTDD